MSNVLATNKTLSSITVSAWTVYYINSSNAELVTVYDSSNNPYDCFKYLLNNVSWFYVLDGIQNSWVNDLISIGYSLSPMELGELIFVDDSTGRVTHGVESLNQIEFSPTGYFLIESDNNVIFVVELPTVSTTGDWDDGNQLYPYGGGSSINTFFAVGEVKDATTDGSSTTTVPYNSENSYCIFDWFTKDAIGLSDVVLVNNNGNLAFSNVSDHTFNIRWFNVAVCSSNQASVVTVYDSGNTAYNSFKYTIDNIDYYYVLDETQTSWTDDLSSIGYSLTPTVVLPTVSDLDWFNFSGAVLQQITIYPGAGSAIAIYVWGSSTTKPYDSSCLYAVSQWNSSSGVRGGATELSIINYNSSGGILGARNDTQNELSVWSVRVYSCSSNQATVVTVYNSSNIAYNAFKYTLEGTDYYYVLDGIQVDWTDDLSSIGYRDYIEATYYYYDKSYTTVSNNSWVYLYDNGTTTIPVDDVSKYEFVKYYTGSTDTTGHDYGITLGVYNGKLTAKNTSGATIVLQRVDVRIHS